MMIHAIQQAVQQAAADTVMMPTLLPAQFTGSTIVVWIIDWLKRSNRVSFMNENSGDINRIAAVIGATITAVGIHFALEPAATGETYTLTITGLSIATVYHFIEAFTISIASQQTILKLYQITNTLRKISEK